MINPDRSNNSSQAMDSKQALGSVIIYTDGAAEPNPGPGGYGVVMLAGKHRKELSGGFRRTTNNRMELMGVIVGLEALTKPCRVTLFSDSKYVVDSVERGSVHRWKKNNWFRTKTDKAKNADLWARFLDVFEKHVVKFKWVKGHAGVPENERCDELAVAAAQSGDLSPDVGYISEIAGGAVLLSMNEDDDEPQPDRLDSQSPDLIYPGKERIPPSVPPLGAGVAHKEAGEPCRKCGVALVKKPTKPKARKAGQTYYYEWYLSCPGCSTMYLVEDAKRSL
jgi:ribonuclease HI